MPLLLACSTVAGDYQFLEDAEYDDEADKEGDAVQEQEEGVLGQEGTSIIVTASGSIQINNKPLAHPHDPQIQKEEDHHNVSFTPTSFIFQS